jgi:hypothetical protein
MLRLSSVPNEYYCGDLPGTLQYNKDKEELIGLVTEGIDEETRGFQLCEHSLENLRRIMPQSQAKRKWKVLLMMKREDGHEIWLKAALMDMDTGKVALLTSTNAKENLERRNNRTIRTVDGTWFVGHYRMSAPMVFWRELKNRLLY